MGEGELGRRARCRVEEGAAVDDGRKEGETIESSYSTSPVSPGSVASLKPSSLLSPRPRATPHPRHLDSTSVQTGFVLSRPLTVSLSSALLILAAR